MMQYLFGQSVSTCYKNDGSWKQQLSDVSFFQSREALSGLHSLESDGYG